MVLQGNKEFVSMGQLKKASQLGKIKTEKYDDNH